MRVYFAAVLGSVGGGVKVVEKWRFEIPVATA
jgi:hypothetical protein